MAKKIEISLIGKIPPNANSVSITFASTPNAKALVHRYEGDVAPVVLHGPKGQTNVNIGDVRTLTLEALDDADWDIAVVGYGF